MEFTKILCLALVIGSANSQPRYQADLTRRINIYYNNPDLLHPATFNLPADNQYIRATDVLEIFRGRRGQGPNEEDVVNAMRRPLAGFLAQAQPHNQRYWDDLTIGNRNEATPNPDYILFRQTMTLQAFMNMLNLSLPRAGHFLGIARIEREMLQQDITVTIGYHATRRGYDNQHHTISFTIAGLRN